MRRVAAFTALWRAFTSAKGPSIGKRMAALPRMIGMTIIGRYDGGGRIFLMVLAVAYLVSPIDLIPELFLLLPGLIDDAVVITWLAGAVLDETERFLNWEATRKGHVVIDGEGR